ncbi:NLI interacting factor-like phosphatase-domain-containing protein [Mycotypha africana]|uniref:NLI interacting factor-like phosphatase-domain-containing protein n=1 Tax=Mycotypha africana TaxID=64632 RepID=UPI0023017878|nr:NLI interacting factor-like phosphatase-domain-containing protein [Mycotypha africana]KAI8973695.1 NLI interacting factor-like phosphatase-domain-containing protein [Mycotypha africana]
MKYNQYTDNFDALYDIVDKHTIQFLNENAEAKFALSPNYISLMKEPSIFHAESSISQKLLILDLKGIFVSRGTTKKKELEFYTRPYTKEFLSFAVKNFTVMVWSSCISTYTNFMCDTIFDELHPAGLIRPLIVWDRSNLELTPTEFEQNLGTVKDLQKVWNVLQQYNAKNTIIMDDCLFKLLRQPYNAILINTFDHNDLRSPDQELLNIIQYLKVLKHQSNVANFIGSNPFDHKTNYDVQQTARDMTMMYYSRTSVGLNRMVITVEIEKMVQAEEARHAAAIQEQEKRRKRAAARVLKKKHAAIVKATESEQLRKTIKSAPLKKPPKARPKEVLRAIFSRPNTLINQLQKRFIQALKDEVKGDVGTFMTQAIQDIVEVIGSGADFSSPPVLKTVEMIYNNIITEHREHMARIHKIAKANIGMKENIFDIKQKPKDEY